MKFAIVVFPGSNGERDCYYVIDKVLGEAVDYVWHQDGSLADYDAVILPGGASYGDYLRVGAIAKHSPIMERVAAFADRGGIVLGIGNGMQILLEANLLPGIMLPNDNLKFVCATRELKVNHINTPFTSDFKENEVITMPIAHGFGNYYCDDVTFEELVANGQVILTYNNDTTNFGKADIAAITNKAGNIAGMMPHPERCAEEILGGIDGLRVFTSIVNHLKGVK